MKGFVKVFVDVLLTFGNLSKQKAFYMKFMQKHSGWVRIGGMKTKKFSFKHLSLMLILGLLSACTMEVSKIEDSMVVPTVPPVTATLYPTFTPRATVTALPSTVMPTVAPIGGKATAQINVRERPSVTSPSLGLLDINSEVQIIGRDENTAWYEIIFTSANGEAKKGWVSAEYILSETQPDVPVTVTKNEDANGKVSQRVNVRSGPGTDFDALGMLDVNEDIVITGTNLDGMWLEIEYAPGAESRGWVYALYVESDVLDDLPIVDETGGEVTIATQTSIAATAAPVYTPAPEDGDSMEKPAIEVTFSTSDSRAFSYSSDVSAPEGDFEDWVSFHPNSENLRVDLLIDLTCSGNGTLYVEMYQGGIMLEQWGELGCGDTNYPLNLYRDETYQFRLYSKYSNNLLYTNYTLEMRVAP